MSRFFLWAKAFNDEWNDLPRRALNCLADFPRGNLPFRVHCFHPAQSIKQTVGNFDASELHAHFLPEKRRRTRGLALAHQPGIHEHAVRPAAERLPC